MGAAAPYAARRRHNSCRPSIDAGMRMYKSPEVQRLGKDPVPLTERGMHEDWALLARLCCGRRSLGTRRQGRLLSPLMSSNFLLSALCTSAFYMAWGGQPTRTLMLCFDRGRDQSIDLTKMYEKSKGAEWRPSLPAPCAAGHLRGERQWGSDAVFHCSFPTLPA